MRVEVKTITPSEAARILENNPKNRAIRRFHVDKIARDMKAGRWQLNGDAIRINCDGSLIDGQHRLTACVLADVPFQTLVVSGLPATVRATIDGGAKRSHGDRLAMDGVSYSTNVSAALRIMSGLATGWTVGRNSDTELDAILAKHPGVIESARVTFAAFEKISAKLCAIHYIGTYLGYGDDADAFVKVFKNGVPTYSGDAAHTLRERMIAHKGKVTQYNSDDTLRALVICWRHFQTKTSIKQIRLSGELSIAGWDKSTLGVA